ncbi:MAG: methylmalonyl-CoA mutase family protein [Thermoanaerobaculia bacterium]|nr:methylmalonyl-CoA mutase family protein [Thermoanaerobaculia bacterium]
MPTIAAEPAVEKPTPKKTSPLETHPTEPYRPKNPVRLITSTALFDGHDASINIMRRLMQATGAEVIHLGHNRSVEDIVRAALQEDAQGVALTSYQGGHMEFFKYLRERLDEVGLTHVKIYGGGGGTIVPEEIEHLQEVDCIDRVFSPEDGRNLGLQGMINQVVRGCDFPVAPIEPIGEGTHQRVARSITRMEIGQPATGVSAPGKEDLAPVVGITGTGGAGKSSLTDELVRRFLGDFGEKRVAIVCADPTRRKTGGALLGDRIRFNTLKHDRVFVRSVATRAAGGEVSESIGGVLEVVRKSFDIVILETAGIGQGDSRVADLCDVSLYVMTAEYGAPSQLEKIDMLDFADFVAINKFTRRGSEDALRDVRKQVQRNRQLFDQRLEDLPVFGTSAAHFNDGGVNALYAHLIAKLDTEFGLGWRSGYEPDDRRVTDGAQAIIPPERERYLAEAAQKCREYRSWAEEQVEVAAEVEALRTVLHVLGQDVPSTWSALSDLVPAERADLATEHDRLLARLDPSCRKQLEEWQHWDSRYRGDVFEYRVRDKKIRVANYRETLSGTRVPKVARPRFRSAADRLRWRLLENVPGEFPFTSGVFPFKREAEDPTRMFAGEGTAERTNQRFHYLADGQVAKRLSTAFDALTLYGEDPGRRPDIYGKIGESGVAVFTVEEAEVLYAGFDLCDPMTSVSMTINGPAPTILAFFFNVAIRQQCRRFLRQEGRLEITEQQELQPDASRGSTWSEVRALLREDEFSRIKEEALQRVRGTVQADILKEDQGQNTCIFSTEFALRCMGDVQQYFTDHGVRNFYSVSISGYHIAEAGANPIHQLAFTLANGLTYVEYYRARGMDVDRFAPNLSFFFSNGMDAEYTVIGRVARRIWAVVLRDLYGANTRSQKLKYHIQTSGRSLHAMEIQFNDIRTTLQALLATYDNAQSLHTNAYDEAITTPTEESVRRAMAIQLIINKEFGMVECENATQGSFLVEELTDLVEEAVLREFERISGRGGVLGAMELQYQRGEIQGDSLKYETLKHTGDLPVVGVNTFLPKDPEAASIPRSVDLTRASQEEKQSSIDKLEEFHARHADRSSAALRKLQETALSGGNLFAQLLAATEVCSLGQVTHALYEVGGEYRRNL